MVETPNWNSSPPDRKRAGTPCITRLTVQKGFVTEVIDAGSVSHLRVIKEEGDGVARSIMDPRVFHAPIYFPLQTLLDDQAIVDAHRDPSHDLLPVRPTLKSGLKVEAPRSHRLQRLSLVFPDNRANSATILDALSEHACAH